MDQQRRRIGIRAALLLGVIALTALAALACDDEPRSPHTAATPDPTPAEGASVAATPAPLTPVEPLPNLRWVPADLPPFTGDELAEPFSTPARGYTEWQVFRVAGSSSPELLLRTERSVLRLEWSDDGRTVSAYLRSKVAGLSAPDLTGLATFDLSGPTPTVSHQLFDGSTSVQRSPDGARIALTAVVGSPTTPFSIFVSERDGRTVKLEGFPFGAGLGGWAPAGDALLVNEFVSNAQGRANGRVLFVPLAGALLLVNARPITTAPEGGSWSPDGTRLAFLDTGFPPDPQADLYVFDRRTGDRRLVAAKQSLQFPGPIWTATGDQILLGGNQLDPATGVISPRITSSAAAGTPWRPISPNGRHMLITDTADWQDPAGCGRLGVQSRNRLYLVELATGDRRLLRDCDSSLVSPAWLENRHVTLMQLGPGYEGVATRAVLLDITTGILRPLTPDLEFSSFSVHALDRGRFLVTGARLRLFDATGTLLRTIEPPPGLEIVEAAWSPDGAQFVYMARTKGVSPYE